MARTETSRLSEIFEFQRKQGRGTLGALGSSLGGRALEKLDIRNLLFGSARAPAKSLAGQLGRSIFGAGYSATGSGRARPSEIGAESALASAKVEKVLSSIDSNMAAMNAKMTLLAKNTIQQNRVARDINVIRQNVILLTKERLGKARTKADMYFMRAGQREKEYEKKLGDESENISVSPTITDEKTESKKNSLGSSLLKGGLAIGGILAVLGTFDRIVESFGQVKNYVESLWMQSQALIDSMKNFDFMAWIQSIDQEKIAGWASSLLTSIVEGFGAAKDFFKGVVSKIPDDVIGSALTGLGNIFLDSMKFIGETLMRGLSTLDTEEILGLAAAGGLYALLFGGTGAKVAGGLIGSLISGVFSGIAKALPALLATLMTPGGLIALGIAGLFAAMKLYFDGKVGGEAGANRLRDQQKTIDAEKARTLSVEDWKKYVDTIAPEFNKDPEVVARRKSLLSMRQIGEAAKITSPAESPALNQDMAEQINLQKVEGAMSPTAMERTRVAENRKRANAVAGGGGWRPPTRPGGTKTTGTTSSQRGVDAKNNLPVGEYQMIAGQKVEAGKPLTEEQKVAIQIRNEMRGGSAPPPPPKVEPNVSQEQAGPKSNVLRTQNIPGGLPNNFDYDTYTKRVGYFESGNDYGIVNTIGYAGRYQFGAQALETLGYMKPGSSKQGNKAMRDPSNWNNGLSLEKFLNSPEIQDEAMAKLTKANYKQMVSRGLVNKDMSSDELAGMLYVAHGVGVGGAMKFARGEHVAEGYGTTANQMFAKASGKQYAGEDMTKYTISSGGLASMDRLASNAPKISGDMFNMPSTDKMGEFGNAIINVINNTMQKAEQATSEALSSIDMDSVKDMFNPMIARATYGFTI